ncbi:cytochrome c biogenesis protein ResB [Geobacter pickeringii]|uniref:ResB-like domain-containing protein n=1 Tax=Geobacter pickeringii TaxID=345632 RepID=A0A0B5BJI1_9BACT|nr:cytochrome c biogenesis protein ResB [Geobacter pickeringii]AJE04660.1 hypothetical protein GPICK_15930 [Geobacter pickeringii]
MFDRLIIFIGSRRTAVWLLAVPAFLLALSTFLPAPQGGGAAEPTGRGFWQGLVAWTAERYDTPHLVRTPFFLALWLFLFISTSICTMQRVLRWLRTHKTDFDAEKGFSWELEVETSQSPSEAAGRFATDLRQLGWQVNGDLGTVVAERGMAGSFWGSVMFHGGLLLCFIAVPVTALTAFSGSLILPEEIPVPIRQTVTVEQGSAEALPDDTITVRNLTARYSQGKYWLAFTGTLHFGGPGDSGSAIAVSRPVSHAGFQFSLQEFGVSPRLIISGLAAPFDYQLNLRHPEEGDWFDLPGGLRLFVLFFPDFFREGNRVGSRSLDERTPRLLYRITDRGGALVGKGILAPGEQGRFPGGEVAFPGFRHWAGLAIGKSSGLGLLMAGFGVVVAGLALRLLGNDRCVTATFETSGQGTLCRVRGQSRYYPAFLKREVANLVATIRKDHEST